MSARGLAPRTLRMRVTIATAVALATVLVVVVALVEDRFRRLANADLDASLDVEADAIAGLVRFEDGKLELDFDGQGRFVRFEEPRGGAYYMVSAPGVDPLTSPSLAGARLEAARFEDGPNARPSGVSAGPFEERVRWNVRRWHLKEVRDEESAPRPDARDLLVELRIARSTVGIDAARAKVRAGLWASVPLGLLLGTTVAYLLAGRATAPIRRLSDEARAVGTGGTGARLDAEHIEGELRELTDTLNGAFDRLETAAERERMFAAAASHELRTPLAVLRARLEVTLSRERTGEQYREALEISLAAGKRLEALTSSLLLLTRMESPRSDRALLDLRNVVEDAVATGPRSSVVGDPHLGLPSSPIFVSGEPPLLERLVAGLVENARTHGGGLDVEVTLDRVGHEAVLQVLDRGPGFPEALLPRLFERFARGDASRSRATGGAGLGLCIAQAIVRSHGGTITASPRNGGGAAVTVRLPLAPAMYGARLETEKFPASAGSETPPF